MPEKGIHYLIEAYRNVKTDKKLVIAGASSDTDAYAQHLREQAQNYVCAKFRWEDVVDKTLELYQ